MDGHEESNLEKTLKPEKRRFFDEDLEDETDSNFENSAVNGELKDDLDIQSSFLFGGKESREVSESSAQDVEEIRSVIPDLSNSPVSYTHLDVYKRQIKDFVCGCGGATS